MSNNLPGSKRDQEPDFTNCDSQDTTSTCEPCEEALNCLVHVEFENKQNSKKYKWKSGVGELVKEANLQIVGFQGEGDSYDPFELKCLVEDSECIGKKGPFPTQCANIYFYEQDSSKEPQVMGEIKQKSQKELLELKFNPDYLDKNKKLVPHYLVAKKLDKEDKAKFDEDTDFSFDIVTEGDALYLKEFTFSVQKSDRMVPKDMIATPTILSAQIINTLVGNALTTFLRRALSFGILSKLDYMPASAFHVAVMNCGCRDMKVLDQKDPQLYNVFDSAVATTYVIPNYELTHSFTIKFDEISGSFTAKKLLKALKKLEFALDIQEKFNGVDGAQAKFIIKDPLEIFKQVFIKNYAMITILIDILDGTPKFLEEHFPKLDKKEIEISNKALFDEIITFEMGLPKISLSGKSTLKVDNGKVKIEREDVKLTANPFVNGTLKFNLASLIIQKTGILGGVYAGLKAVAEGANKFTNKVRLDITTNKDFRDEFSAVDKAERANALVEGSLVVYAEFLIKPAINLAINIENSELNETKFTPDMKKMVEIGLEFSAGVAVRGRIHRFYGGLDAGFEISTALSYGLKAYPRKNASGEEYQEYVDFLYFNGLTATWKVEIYGGTDYDAAKIERNDLDEIRYKNGKEENIDREEEKYFDPKKAAQERDSLQKDYDSHTDYVAKAKAKRGPVIGGGAGMDLGLEARADDLYPGSKRYLQLSKQLNFYNQNRHILEEIQRLNSDLFCTFDANERIRILEKKYRLTRQVQAGMVDYDIKLPPGSYYLWSASEEYDARQEYIEHLQRQQQDWENRLERIKKEHALFPNDNDPKTRAQKDKFLQSKLERAKSAQRESKRLEDEIKAVQDIDDINRESLFSSHLFGARSLTVAEREALKNELKTD